MGLTMATKNRIKKVVSVFKKESMTGKERIEAILSNDRYDLEMTREQTQCLICDFRIHHKNEMSNVNLCAFGHDMDDCSNCVDFRDRFGVKETITKADYMEACK